jgi:small subunit ribosomal protein S16
LVKIRLKRMGAKKRPFYRLVVADSRSPRDGRFIELLGYYDPLTNPAKVQVDADKVRDWMRKGARPSDAARALLVEQGILAKVPRVFKPAPETAAAPTVAAPTAAVETPAAEPAAADAEPVAEAEPTAEAETAADAETEPAAQADAAEADVTP